MYSTTRELFWNYSLYMIGNDPVVTITERNFNLACDLAVLAGNDQFDLPELIPGQTVIEKLEYAINAAIEFPFLGFGVVRTADSTLHGEASMVSREMRSRFSGLPAITELLLEHFADLVDIVPHAAKDPDGSKVKEYARTVQHGRKDRVVPGEIR